MNQTAAVVKDERHVRIEMLKAGLVVFSDVVVSEEAGRRCARIYAPCYEEVEPGADLVRYELGSIVVRAFFTNESVSEIASKARQQEHARLQRYARMTCDLEAAAQDLETLRDETGLGNVHLLPAPELLNPRIEVGRWVVFRDSSERAPVATLSSETARIESVSTSAKMVEVCDPEGINRGTPKNVWVRDIAGSFPTREAALLAIEHSNVTHSMMAVLWNARVASMAAILNEAARLTSQ
jgi:hypothetical protein